MRLIDVITEALAPVFQRRYERMPDRPSKLHTVNLVQAINVLVVLKMLYILFKPINFDSVAFGNYAKYGFYAAMFMISVSAVYFVTAAAYELLFFSYLQRAGYNRDSNFILEDSAGGARAAFFWLCVISVLVNLVFRPVKVELPYWSGTVFFVFLVSYANIFIEGMRLSGSAKWSNAKHARYMVLAALGALLLVLFQFYATK